MKPRARVPVNATFTLESQNTRIRNKCEAIFWTKQKQKMPENHVKKEEEKTPNNNLFPTIKRKIVKNNEIYVVCSSKDTLYT